MCGHFNQSSVISYQFGSCQFRSYRFRSCQFRSYQFRSYQFGSCQFRSYQFGSYQFRSYQFRSYQFRSYQFGSFQLSVIVSNRALQGSLLKKNDVQKRFCFITKNGKVSDASRFGVAHCRLIIRIG
uniref:pentapeptide repeat-containing protein n=1 Tax=Planktothrix paucivesiculata TaxID=1678308 RepID=UPI0018CC0517